MVSTYDLPKPDSLHTILKGVLSDHLMLWIIAFLKKHQRLVIFDDMWKSMPPYPNFSPPLRSFLEVEQWQGKEMRTFSKIIVVCLATALSSPKSDVERNVFSKAILCTRKVIDFYLMSQYSSHTDKTIEYLEGFLKDFHVYKDVFLEF